MAASNKRHIIFRVFVAGGVISGARFAMIRKKEQKADKKLSNVQLLWLNERFTMNSEQLGFSSYLHFFGGVGFLLTPSFLSFFLQVIMRF